MTVDGKRAKQLAVLTYIPEVEYDINERWENGTDHHPKSEELFKRIADIDFKHCNDYFCWKSGGDGDNGETLMYILDIIFEEDEGKLDENKR